MSQMYLQAQHTAAPYLIFTKDGKSHPAQNMGVKSMNQDDPLLKAAIKAHFGSELVRIEKRRKYYWLPLGYYNQPNGNVEEIELFPSDYQALKEAELKDRYPYWWIYEDYATALNRALD